MIMTLQCSNPLHGSFQWSHCGQKGFLAGIYRFWSLNLDDRLGSLETQSVLAIILGQQNAEGGLSIWNQRNRRRVDAQLSAVSFGKQPAAEASIVNLRYTVPESWFQGANNDQMIHVQLNGCCISGKVPSHVADTHVQTKNPRGTCLTTLRWNYQCPPLLGPG